MQASFYLNGYAMGEVCLRQRLGFEGRGLHRQMGGS